ncbi:TetR family transcriptional regulator C-terminal domain-containing protein [Pseudorhodoplanes sp.]|uniref:TetR family transcriptional regulator C-terminal domain-containing protein n=1 Tax=Pseudorhodoplanes sp. TaxID=1934341 RepID=UPI003D09B749
MGSQQGLDRLEADFRVMFPSTTTNLPPPNFWLEFWAQASRDEGLCQQHLARFQMTRKHYEQAVRHELAARKVQPDIDVSLLADALATLSLGFEVRVSLDGESISQERAFQSTKQVLDLIRLLLHALDR